MPSITLLACFLLMCSAAYAQPPVVGFGPNLPLPDTSADDLATINSEGKALSAAAAVSGVTTVTAGAAATVFAAATRNFLRLASNNSATGSDPGCTDDGSTPSATHWSIRVFATTFYEAMRPGFISNQAIQCIGISGTVAFVGEQY